MLRILAWSLQSSIQNNRCFLPFNPMWIRPRSLYFSEVEVLVSTPGFPSLGIEGWVHYYCYFRATGVFTHLPFGPGGINLTQRVENPTIAKKIKINKSFLPYECRVMSKYLFGSNWYLILQRKYLISIKREGRVHPPSHLTALIFIFGFSF